MAASSVFFMHARYNRNEFAWNIKDPSEANFKLSIAITQHALDVFR